MQLRSVRNGSIFPEYFVFSFTFGWSSQAFAYTLLSRLLIGSLAGTFHLYFELVLCVYSRFMLALRYNGTATKTL